MSDQQVLPAKYIGDGVYIEFDGYQYVLHANTYPSTLRVYLPPEVLEQVIIYDQRIKAEIQKLKE